MKSGIAMIGHESKAVNIRCGTRTRGRLGSDKRAKTEPVPRAKATGMPIMKNRAIETNKISIFSSL